MLRCGKFTVWLKLFPELWLLKGCDSSFEVKCSNVKLLQMKQLPNALNNLFYKALENYNNNELQFNRHDFR